MQEKQQIEQLKTDDEIKAWYGHPRCVMILLGWRVG